MGKSWFKSKTLWVNVLSIVTIVAGSEFGYVITPETQVYILSAVNFALRFVTSEPVEWS